MALRSVEIYVAKEYYPALAGRPSGCVSSLFNRLMGKVQAPGVVQMNVWLSDAEKDRDRSALSGKYLDWYVPFDFSSLAAATDPTAIKRMYLDAMVAGLLAASSRFGWNPAPFRATAARMNELGFRNEWFFRRKVFRSPDHQHHFGLLHVFELNTFDIHEVLLDRTKTELKRRRILSLETDLFRIAWAAWEDAHVFTYRFDGPKKLFRCDIEELLASTDQLPSPPTDTSRFFK